MLKVLKAKMFGMLIQDFRHCLLFVYFQPQTGITASCQHFVVILVVMHTFMQTPSAQFPFAECGRPPREFPLLFNYQKLSNDQIQPPDHPNSDSASNCSITSIFPPKTVQLADSPQLLHISSFFGLMASCCYFLFDIQSTVTVYAHILRRSVKFFFAMQDE